MPKYSGNLGIYYIYKNLNRNQIICKIAPQSKGILKPSTYDLLPLEMRGTSMLA
jgi:hypothetical protein